MAHDLVAAVSVSGAPSVDPTGGGPAPDTQRADARALEYLGAFLAPTLLDAPMGVAFVDTDLRCLWVNAAFTALSGHRAAEAVGRRMGDLLPSGRPTIEDHLREVLQKDRSPVDASLVEATPAAGARPRHWRATIFAVHGKDGTLLGACCVCADVSDVMLLVEQYWQSQKHEAVGRLAGVVAHDFNNLLTVIQGYSDLLLRDSSDADKRAKRLEAIRSAAEAAGQLSKQLLTISRRNTGAVGPVDLNLLVRAIGGMLDRLLPPNIAKELALDETLWLTLADPGQLEQVLMNLITNAIDAMPAGGRLRIETSNAPAAGAPAAGRQPSGDFVILRVDDTGLGMDARTQARLFEPLFSTKPPDRGTGLGLATVRAMVDQLGGSVSVESTEGHGTTVTVRLRRVRERPRPPIERPVVPPGTRPATVLLVEDSEELRPAVVTLLQLNGFSVLAVASGGDARRMADEHDGPIDLLLTDVELPDANGLELAERLQRARPGMRVLITSGFGESALADPETASQRYPFVAKPFTMTELVAKIFEILYPSSPVATS
ncbi:MAG: response regulator [Gemmatimonadetes bacterium]|nr:response regulator [Gemmatimonadota bacterium]